MSGLFDTSETSTAMLVLIVSTILMFGVAISFLVTAWLLRRANNRKSENWAKLEASWGALVDRIASGTLPPDAMHRRVAPADRLMFLDYIYKSIHNETRPQYKQLYRDLAGPYLGDLESRVKAGDVWQRARAIRTVAELTGQDRGGVIMAALDDPAPHVALTAARTYARLGLGPIHPLLDRIERYQEWDRRLLRLTLASFGQAAAPALHDRLSNAAASPSIRAVCADALNQLDYPPANDTALTILREETDMDLRAAALRLIRPPVADRHRYVVRSLCAAEDPVLRAQAVACLARIGEESDLSEVERALADLSPWVVLSAARGLTRRRNTPVGQAHATPTKD